MLVLDTGLEALPEEEAFDVQTHALGPVEERIGNEDLDVARREVSVPGAHLFALEIGVDRHLGVAASTDGRNEVERGRAPSAGNEPNSTVAH